MVKYCDYCGDPAIAKSMCRMHYGRDRKGLDMFKPKHTVFSKERVMQYVDKNADGHWYWTGYVSIPTKGSNSWGYAQCRNEEGRKEPAHRVVYRLHGGVIPEGYEVDHLCKVRHCVNPEHLEAVTKYENMMRGNVGAAINKRKTHCIRGHELAGENLYVTPYGGRVCVECRRARYKKWYDEHARKGD